MFFAIFYDDYHISKDLIQYKIIVEMNCCLGIFIINDLNWFVYIFLNGGSTNNIYG